MTKAIEEIEKGGRIDRTTAKWKCSSETCTDNKQHKPCGLEMNKWKNKNSDWNNNERKQVFYCNSIIEFAKCDKEKERNKILSKLVNLSVK